MAENGKKETPYVPITSPVGSLQVLQQVVGRLLEWDRIPELDEATDGDVSRVVATIFQSLEPVQGIIEEDRADYMEWEVPAPLLMRFFGPLFYYLRDAEECTHCYEYGRVYLHLMAEKLIEQGAFDHRDLIHVGLARFDTEPTDCHLHQTPGGDDE